MSDTQISSEIYSYPLLYEKGHLFILIDNEKYLLDTGAPLSFGKPPSLNLGGSHFDLPDSYGPLDADTLSFYIDTEVSGLIGVEILNRFDSIFDMPSKQIRVSTDSLTLEGTLIPLEQFMGIPIIEVTINGSRQRMFFDTGAQISYWQSETLDSFPSLGKMRDFYPGFGEFETDTYLLSLSTSSVDYALVCGSLPELLEEMLTMASVEGIIGNEMIKDRIMGYFPRKNRIVLG